MVLNEPGIFQHFAVAIAQNVGGEPAAHPQHARLQSRRDQRLHERLAGLEILAADRNVALARQFQQRRRIGGQIRRAVGERHAGLQRGISVNLAGRDLRIVLLQAAFEILQRLMHGARLVENFGGPAPDHHQALTPLVFAELPDVVHQHFRLVHLGAACFTLGPLMRRMYSGSNTAFIGLMALERLLQLLEQRRSSTSAFTAAS